MYSNDKEYCRNLPLNIESGTNFRRNFICKIWLPKRTWSMSKNPNLIENCAIRYAVVVRVVVVVSGSCSGVNVAHIDIVVGRSRSTRRMDVLYCPNSEQY